MEVGDEATLRANRELVGYRSRDGREVGVSRPHFHSSNSTTLGWTDCPHGPNNLPGGNYRPGLVLDPFAGSGTTCAVADLHGRDAIGIDFDARNKAIYPARYDEVKRALFGTPAPMPGQETFDFAI